MYWKTYIYVSFLRRVIVSLDKAISHSVINYYHLSFPPLLLAETLHVY